VSTAIAVYHGPFGRVTLYSLDRPMTVHAHREGHLLFHVDGPAGQVEVSGRPQPLAPDHAVAVNPWEPHAFLPAIADAPGLYLVLYVDPLWFLKGGMARDAIRFGAPSIRMDQTIRARAADVVRLMLSSDAMSRLDGAVRGLVEQAFRATWFGKERPRAIVLPTSTGADFRVRKAVRLISDNLAGDLEFDRVARESGLSRPHFYKLFRHCLGVTPNMFMTMLRMEKAVSLLAASDRSVTDIGYDLGFSSQSVFTRIFSANVGMAPSDYRRVVRVIPGRGEQFETDGHGGSAPPA
jgi:AraC-like DNA-binding protein